MQNSKKRERERDSMENINVTHHREFTFVYLTSLSVKTGEKKKREAQKRKNTQIKGLPAFRCYSLMRVATQRLVMGKIFAFVVLHDM